MASLVAFHARVRLLPSSEGGWKSPVAARFMCLCDVGKQHRGKPVFLDARLTLEDGRELTPGEEAVFLVEPLHAELWDHVVAGQAFSLHEGFSARGHGVVVDRFFQGDVQ
jgi:hypothetical protein